MQATSFPPFFSGKFMSWRSYSQAFAFYSNEKHMLDKRLSVQNANPSEGGSVNKTVRSQTLLQTKLYLLDITKLNDQINI